MNEHEWFTDRIAAYLAGGLPDDEQLRFEAHRATCAECATEFESIEQTEKTMTQLFADVVPGMDFEQRVLSRLRFSNPLRIHPLVRRAAIAASVAIVLGGFGYVANRQMQNGGLDPTNLKLFGKLTGKDRPAEPDRATNTSVDLYYASLTPTTQPSAPGAQADGKWDFGGGSPTAANFDDWEVALNRGKVSEKPVSSLSSARNDTTLGDVSGKLSYGDGHADVQRNPFTGVARDMDFTRDRFNQIANDNGRLAVPIIDRLPAIKDIDGDGIANTNLGNTPALSSNSDYYMGGKVTRTGTYNATPPRSNIALKGVNDYDGTVTVNGGVLNNQTIPMYSQGTAVSGGTANVGPIHGSSTAEGLRQQIVTGTPIGGTNSPAPAARSAEPGFRATSNQSHEFYFTPYAGDSDTKGKAGEVKQELAEVDSGRKSGRATQLGTEVALQDKEGLDAPKPGQGQFGNGNGNGRGQNGNAQVQNGNGPAQQPAPAADVPAPALHAEPTPDEVRRIVEAQQEQSAPTTQAAIVRKVIRNGDITFEVDSFDSSTLTITKIVTEEGGYVATTNSDKLPNGKVKGTIVVRIPPDHLDTLVLKLRALGDLKSQNLTADDVTKQYTDTASELRASRAMEDRLLNIIKNSQGQIKDLLAAEKELATWREKSEKLEGQIRYYDNLVALSTLNISLFERDIRKADVLKETENVDMGVETEDVEASRASAIKAIEDAKGRIVESELKKLDAGQLAAKVVAEIPPDASGPALDQLKQIGRVARLETHREQKSNNDQPPVTGTKVERGETHLTLSLYNLANVAPRSTDNLNLAADDVEGAYNAIVKLARDADGRIVTSNLNRQTDQQTNGVVQFEVKSADAETILSKVRGNGEVTRLTVTENPDTNNVTNAKRGFNVQIVSLASLLPREVTNLSLASADVDASYQQLLQNLRKNKSRIIVSRIEDLGKGQHNAYVDFEVPRAQLDEIEKAMTAAGETYNRSVNAVQDADNVTDSKVQFKLGLAPAWALPAREIDALAVETSDVDAAAQSFQNAAKSAGGRVIDANFSKDQHGQTARLIVEVPFANANQIVAEAKHLGTVRGSQQGTNQQAPSGEFARARIELTLASPDVLVAPEHGVFATLRSGLSTSFAGLMWSLQLIVIGLCLVAPWVVLIWLGVKVLKRTRRKTSVAAA